MSFKLRCAHIFNHLSSKQSEKSVRGEIFNVNFN